MDRLPYKKISVVAERYRIIRTIRTSNVDLSNCIICTVQHYVLLKLKHILNNLAYLILFLIMYSVYKPSFTTNLKNFNLKTQLHHLYAVHHYIKIINK